MLPILGDPNRQAAWPARIAKLRASVPRTSEADLRIAGMFVESEKSLTEAAPASDALRRSLELLNQHARSERAQLTDRFLVELQHTLGIAEGLRGLPMDGQVPGHNPAKPAAIAALLENT